MHVLLIEDDIDTQMFIKGRLQEKGAKITCVRDGCQGLLLATSNSYDIVLLNLELPKKNGMEICKSIRMAGFSVPIIVLSRTHESQHKIPCFSIGADDYITKPFFFDELYARMQALVRRCNIHYSSILNFGNLTIDVHRQKVLRGKQSIYLTRKEFCLLELLAKNAGKVVTRNTINDHLWNSEVDLLSNTIETHISNLRKKIDARQNPKLICNVPGRGYKLDVNL